MSWLILCLAGVLEIVWAVGLKLCDGRPLIMSATVVSAILSMVLLGVSMKHISPGTAYAVWTGIGIVGTFFVGASLGEPVTASRMISTALILAGVVGLRLSDIK